MKLRQRTISRTVITLAVAGLGLVLTAGRAHAAPLTFVVFEGAVTGANAVFVTPDPNGITGKYREELTLTGGNPFVAGSSGDFSADIAVDFSAYTLNGSGVTDQIGATGAGDTTPNEYGLYALVTASGTWESAILFGDLVVRFFPDDSHADVSTDPLQDTTLDYTVPAAVAGTIDDQPVMTANGLDPGPSFGSVTFVGTSTTVRGGSYTLVYTDIDVLLDAYWPTLAVLELNLEATASGDVDPDREGSVFPTDVRGDTSIAFQAGQIPEPASLTLLGMGLVGAVAARRRRRTA